MTFKETLFFIAKCLTINHEAHNNVIVEKELKSGTVDWDAVVKMSTGHFVFPALYCNLKRAGFLHYLPEDLVVYMQHITDLNRERNQQIIDQAKEINALLLANNITPIFLKGTGNLLEGLYEDLAERMVGDIDLIIKKSDVEASNLILKEAGYYSNSTLFKTHRHLPRLIHEDKIAAIEIHKELLIEKYTDEFNYTYVQKDSQVINGVHVMSFENQLTLSIIAKQINDAGFHYKNMSLRNAYDVFLLSKKTSTENIFHNFDKLQHPLNCFLASCYTVFNKPTSLVYNDSKEIRAYLKFFNAQLNNQKLSNKHHKQTKRKLFIKSRATILYKSIFDKDHRNWLLKRITDKDWQQQKLADLGLKKPTPNS